MNLKTLVTTTLLVGLLFSGCATIVKGGDPQTFNLESEPNSADVVIKDIRSEAVIITQKRL